MTQGTGTPGSCSWGLTAEELSLVLAELASMLDGLSIRDVVRLRERDDLLLFFAAESKGRRALQVAPGGTRARICTTTRHFRALEFQEGPLVDELKKLLHGRPYLGFEHQPGERHCRLDFGTEPESCLHLQVELFGNRGLWCLTDATKKILQLSRIPKSKTRQLRPGSTYQAPALPPASKRPARPHPPRFAVPCLAAVDALFQAQDLEAETTRGKEELGRILLRARKKLEDRIAGVKRQQEEILEAPGLRFRADMLLAHGFQLPAGATELKVPDPTDPARSHCFALQPGKPIQVQAANLYKRARKLEDSAAIAAERGQQAQARLHDWEGLEAKIEACSSASALEALRQDFVVRGILPAKARPESKAIKKITKGHPFRRYESKEGYLILVGRTHQENDSLSISVARGNDLWFHIGGGRAGSHVVVRLPRGKPASLETLLDAGQLALHFSKLRGVGRADVLYTEAKNVSKPRGLPKGRVLATQTRTLRVEAEPERLRRLLQQPSGNSK